jgi:hypothetical protein
MRRAVPDGHETACLHGEIRAMRACVTGSCHQIELDGCWLLGCSLWAGIYRHAHHPDLRSREDGDPLVDAARSHPDLAYPFLS